MLRSMSSKQFQEWLMFANLEPFGEDREDARFGSMVQVLMNIHRSSKHHPSPYKLAQAVLSGGDAFEGEEVKQTQSWEEMKLIGMLTSATSNKGKGS